ncbi:MAG: M20/M25/M40 family metallo-hydrolase, partial [Bacteroidota bacterium]
MKKILIFLFILLILLGGFMIYNATQLSSRQKLVELGVASPPINVESASRRLAKAVQQYTTSVPGKIDTAAMRGLHRVMKESFPGIDSVLKKDTVNQFSLLYTWPGSDADLKPIVLMSHMDVVPVPEEDLEKWTYPPMSGRIQDDYIWGRGTLDDKVGVMGIMEAVEQLIEEGFVPKRTTYLAFGHDEEIGGRRGAKAIAELLSTRGVKAKFVLDEGMVVTEGVVPGIEVPAPLIGISEKGFATLELTVKGEGGHSSMPPPQTSIGILSKAISEIEANPMPVDLDGPFGTFLTYTAPEMSFGYKMIFGNMWLLKPVIISQLSKSPTTNAAIRTTAATTMIQGGVKDNILPTVATAKVNFRILPGQTIEEVVAHATEVIDDER